MANEEVVEVEAYEAGEDSVDEATPIKWWARALLTGLAMPWIVVFIVAISLDPYDSDDGGPRRMGTHMQLGLPDCNFKSIAGVPCPSCGMTTSFSLLMHADVWNSMKANFAGTALCAFGLIFVPWAFASAFCGRFVLVRRLEMLIFRLAIIFLVLLFGRWGIVLLMEYFQN